MFGEKIVNVGMDDLIRLENKLQQCLDLLSQHNQS